MRRWIKRKLYDTGTAQKMGSFEGGQKGSFKYYEETLYRKSSGEYFLYGKGGAMTRYAKADPYGEGFTGGEDITPLTVTTALDWVEEHLPPEEFEKIMAMEEEKKKDPSRSVTFELTIEERDRLQQAAEKSGMTQGEYIRKIVLDAIDGK